VAQLASYSETRPHSTDLTSKSDDEKSAALIDATRAIDELRHKGWLRFADGRLHQPRSGLYDRDSRLYDDETICDPMVEAVCEMALSLLAADRRADSPMAGYAEVKIGPLEFTADKHDRSAVIPASSWDKIEHLVLDSRPGGIRMMSVMTG